MSKPDVEKIHEEYYRAFHRGRIFDIVRQIDGWGITFQGIHNLEAMFVAPTIEEVSEWLQIQEVFPTKKESSC